MSAYRGQKGGKLELTHLIDVGLWQSMLDSLSAELGTGIRIFDEKKRVILQSGVAELCWEAMKKMAKHPACFACCTIEGCPEEGHPGFALCPYCDRLINFVFSVKINGVEGRVLVGPAWIAEKGGGATVARLARRFGVGQAKFGQLSAKLRAYSLEDFRRAGEMVHSTMRVIVQSMSAGLGLAKEASRLRESLRVEKKRTWREMVSDRLTGVYGYNYGVARLKEEVSRAERYNQSFSVVVIGVEQLRSYADRHGAEAVTAVLSGIGMLLRTRSRSTDLSVRLREEEFLLILPYTSEEGAQAVLDRFRGEIKALSLVDEKGQALEAPSLAEGLAVYPADGKNERDLLRQALEKMRH